MVCDVPKRYTITHIILYKDYYNQLNCINYYLLIITSTLMNSLINYIILQLFFIQHNNIKLNFITL